MTWEANRVIILWLCVVFGESHLAVLSLTDVIVRSRCFELSFLARRAMRETRWRVRPRWRMSAPPSGRP
jgi:hypothetical protein